MTNGNKPPGQVEGEGYRSTVGGHDAARAEREAAKRPASPAGASKRSWIDKLLGRNRGQ